MATSPPIALTIAGSDCCAGAGIQTDLKTFAAHDVYGLSAVTAIVSEVPGKVAGIEAVSDELLASQVEILLDHYPVAAIKTGMLYSASKVEAISDHLASFGGPIIVDPVLIASSGDDLASADLVGAMKARIFPHASLLTPNIDEIETLIGCKIGTSNDLESAARELSEQFGCAVLAKGGHLDTGEICIDVLVEAGSALRFSVPRLKGVSTHGTGCTLASAIAARVAKGESLAKACENSQAWLHAAMKHAHRWPGGLEALNF